MARYHGRKGAVYMSTSGTGTASQVISLNAWSLDMSTDIQETTSFGDANKTYVQGLKDLKGRFSGFWDNSETKLFTGADSADGVKLYLYPSTDIPGSYFYGPAWVNMSIDVGVGDAVKITANFVANGSWGRQGI
jgi:hypothetical protein